jgi:hypothetical protein
MNECIEWERAIADTLHQEDYKRFATIKMLGKQYRNLHPGQPDPTAKRRILIVWITELHQPVKKKTSQHIRDTRRDLIMADLLHEQWTTLVLAGFKPSNCSAQPKRAAAKTLYTLFRSFTQVIKRVHTIFITTSSIKNTRPTMVQWESQDQAAWWDICGGRPSSARWDHWCLLYIKVLPDETAPAMELSLRTLSRHASEVYNQYRTTGVRKTSKFVNSSLENASHPYHALESGIIRELVNVGQLTVTRSSWYKFVLRASKPFRWFSQQIYNAVNKQTSKTSASIIIVCRSDMRFVSSLVDLMQNPPSNETDGFFNRSKLIVNTHAGKYTSEDYKREWGELRGSKSCFTWEMNTNQTSASCN